MYEWVSPQITTKNINILEIRYRCLIAIPAYDNDYNQNLKLLLRGKKKNILTALFQIAEKSEWIFER